jgi:hypothetical protein
MDALVELYGNRAFQEVKQKPIEQIMKGNILKGNITNKDNSYGNSRSYRFEVDGDCQFSFNQIPFPNCCGIAILRDLSTSSEISRENFNDAINQLVKDLQENDRYSKILIYTTLTSKESQMFQNYPDIIILDPFKNRRSSNILVGFELNLLQHTTPQIWHDPFDLDLMEEPMEDDGEHDEEDESEFEPTEEEEEMIARRREEIRRRRDASMIARPQIDDGRRPIITGEGIHAQIEISNIRHYNSNGTIVSTPNAFRDLDDTTTR